MTNAIKEMCLAPENQAEIMQGNIAFAVGCVRGGIHAVDGYPGTPSSEVIDKGLSQVQDLIRVGWSVNEAVASAVGMGHSMAGSDCVVTMKIPGVFQAGDIFTSGALFVQERGALVYYIASDFTPSSTQHTIDPRYFFKSCFVPVFEPRSHQEMHEAPALAVEIARKYRTQVVVMPEGHLCHSEGLVRLMPVQKREPVAMPEDLKSFNVLPNIARRNYDKMMAERMPALVEMVEESPLNRWEKAARASGKIGVITCGINDLYLREIREVYGDRFDMLSLAFTSPLPMKLIREFYDSIDGDVYVFEDGYQYLQENLAQAGMRVIGKEPFSQITEWSPAAIAARLGLMEEKESRTYPAVVRPPVICAGCPYRLIAGELALLKKKKQLDVVFGDIGCNTLLYFMNALDTGLAMGASEAERIGYVVSRPEQAGRVISLIGDSTECHSGMAGTRNAIYRNTPGVKVILDNSWAGMTGGQPSATSPANLAGEKMRFDLAASLAAYGAKVVQVGAYEKDGIRQALKTALAEASHGEYTTIVVGDGGCIQMINKSSQRVKVDPDACKKCGACLVCPGLEEGADGVPYVTNLCSGCGGQTPACVQMCPTHVLKVVDLKDLDLPSMPAHPAPPEIVIPVIAKKRPERLSLAIRGVGGQGSLFFGHVLTQLASLAGYTEDNIIKGETHGMAQMGGPVISTFACGKALSPQPLPGSVDCLLVMEKGEVLRPGFLALLKTGGKVILAGTRIIPPGMSAEQYPSDAVIREALEGVEVFEVDILARALELGDASGRIANVVMMGLLSTLSPFDQFPPEMWQQALKNANAKPAVWAANYAAFNAGRAVKV